jgi:hypothetical protein
MACKDMSTIAIRHILTIAYRSWSKIIRVCMNIHTHRCHSEWGYAYHPMVRGIYIVDIYYVIDDITHRIDKCMREWRREHEELYTLSFMQPPMLWHTNTWSLCISRSSYCVDDMMNQYGRRNYLSTGTWGGIVGTTAHVLLLFVLDKNTVLWVCSTVYIRLQYIEGPSYVRSA